MIIYIDLIKLIRISDFQYGQEIRLIAVQHYTIKERTNNKFTTAGKQIVRKKVKLINN